MLIKVQKNLEQIVNELSQVEQALKNQPEGTLIVCGRGMYTKWYKSQNGKKEYIPKKQRDVAVKLAEKVYLTEKYRELSQKKKVLERFINRYTKIPTKTQKMLSELKYSELLQEKYKDKAPDIESWLEKNYEHNPNYLERLIHKTYAGHMVRSKSEAIISNAFYIHKIPYKYECPLVLPQGVFYPDFTILHPKTKKIWYYEHFGRMDDPIYAEKTAKKIEIFANNGIVMGMNFLATFETENNPLDSLWVEDMIRYYFE